MCSLKFENCPKFSHPIVYNRQYFEFPALPKSITQLIAREIQNTEDENYPESLAVPVITLYTFCDSSIISSFEFGLSAIFMSVMHLSLNFIRVWLFSKILFSVCKSTEKILLFSESHSDTYYYHIRQLSNQQPLKVHADSKHLRFAQILWCTLSLQLY